MKSNKRRIYAAIALLLAFAVFTVLVSIIDKRAIGPNGSAVGFSYINGCFHRLTGVHITLYTITDWLGLVPVAFAFGFALLGLKQWIQRKSLLKTDKSLLLLGGFYICVLFVYILFEKNVVNHRPVLIDGYLEASYPSITTLLTLCVMPTADMQLKVRLKNALLCKCASVFIRIFTVFMVTARLVSGVHWLTDIAGGILVSAGLVIMYRYFDCLISYKEGTAKLTLSA